MTPVPNASGAITSLVPGILIVVAVFLIIGGTSDDVGALTRTVRR